MLRNSWMLYGAYGYTGTLVAEEAARRGHRPILAGRSAEKLRPLAERLNLPWKAIDLSDRSALVDALAEVDLVFHSAGPFIHTSEPMVSACLAAKTSYVDVTGEIPVFEATLAKDAQAKEAGIALISGVGFDVIPTDCLAKYVADAVPGATDLELAIAMPGQPSAGTAKSMIEMMPKGNFLRRGGELVPAPLGAEIQKVRFPDKERTVMAIPWGDLVTAYKTTGIPNITTYSARPESEARVLKAAGPLIQRALSIDPLRKGLLKLADRFVRGPSEEARDRARFWIWARAKDAAGREREAWLSTPEGYNFTARGGVLSVERLLKAMGSQPGQSEDQTNPSQGRLTGALTPALAFGADFVLDIEGTRRYDSLP